MPDFLRSPPPGCESEMLGRGPFSFVRHTPQDPTCLGAGCQQVFVDGRKGRRMGGRERGREEGKEEWGNEGRKGGREGKWLQGCHWIWKQLKSLSHLSEHLQPLVITFASFSLWILCQHGGPVPIISFWCHVWCIHSILRWAVGNAEGLAPHGIMIAHEQMEGPSKLCPQETFLILPFGACELLLEGCTI